MEANAASSDPQGRFPLPPGFFIHPNRKDLQPLPLGDLRASQNVLWSKKYEPTKFRGKRTNRRALVDNLIFLFRSLLFYVDLQHNNEDFWTMVAEDWGLANMPETYRIVKYYMVCRWDFVQYHHECGHQQNVIEKRDVLLCLLVDEWSQTFTMEYYPPTTGMNDPRVQELRRSWVFGRDFQRGALFDADRPLSLRGVKLKTGHTFGRWLEGPGMPAPSAEHSKPQSLPTPQHHVRGQMLLVPPEPRGFQTRPATNPRPRALTLPPLPRAAEDIKNSPPRAVKRDHDVFSEDGKKLLYSVPEAPAHMTTESIKPKEPPSEGQPGTSSSPFDVESQCSLEQPGRESKRARWNGQENIPQELPTAIVENGKPQEATDAVASENKTKKGKEKKGREGRGQQDSIDGEEHNEADENCFDTIRTKNKESRRKASATEKSASSRRIKKQLTRLHTGIAESSGRLEEREEQEDSSGIQTAVNEDQLDETAASTGTKKRRDEQILALEKRVERMEKRRSKDLKVLRALKTCFREANQKNMQGLRDLMNSTSLLGNIVGNLAETTTAVAATRRTVDKHGNDSSIVGQAQEAAKTKKLGKVRKTKKGTVEVDDAEPAQSVEAKKAGKAKKDRGTKTKKENK